MFSACNTIKMILTFYFPFHSVTWVLNKKKCVLSFTCLRLRFISTGYITIVSVYNRHHHSLNLSTLSFPLLQRLSRPSSAPLAGDKYMLQLLNPMGGSWKELPFIDPYLKFHIWMDWVFLLWIECVAASCMATQQCRSAIRFQRSESNTISGLCNMWRYGK